MNMLKSSSLKGKIIYVFLGLIILLHIFILLKIVFFPYPEFFIYPYLTNNGLKPYSQILDQHFPGLMFLPVNFDNLGMTNEITARAWLILIVVITHILLFSITAYFLRSKKRALLVSVLYMVWQPFFEGWVLWIDNFIPLFLLPAFYYFNKSKFFLVGLFIGLGILFKQTVIPLSGLIFLYIFWTERSFNKLKNYVAGLFLPIVPMVLYFIYQGVFGDFWYWTVTFNLTVYASNGTQIPTSVGFISRVFMVYITSFLVYLHNDKRIAVTLFIFLLGALVGAFDRANFVHFQPSLPFVLLGTVLGIYSLKNRKVLLIAAGIYLIITAWWLNIFFKGHLSNHVFFFDESTYQIAEKIMVYTAPGDKIFVFGAAPHLYQMTQTLPAGDIFVFQFPWFLSVTEDRILKGIKKDQPEIIVADRSVDIEGEKITDFARKIDEYILKNYEVIDSLKETMIFKKKVSSYE